MTSDINDTLLRFYKLFKYDPPNGTVTYVDLKNIYIKISYAFLYNILNIQSAFEIKKYNQKKRSAKINYIKKIFYLIFKISLLKKNYNFERCVLHIHKIIMIRHNYQFIVSKNLNVISTRWT